MKNEKKNEEYTSDILERLLTEVDPIQLKQTKNKMLLAAKIEDGINAKDWTKSKFAQKMHKNPSEVSKWLSGTHNFTTDTLTEIEEVLGIKLLSLNQEEKLQVVERKQVSVTVKAKGDQQFQPTIYAILQNDAKLLYFRTEVTSHC